MINKLRQSDEAPTPCAHLGSLLLAGAAKDDDSHNSDDHGDEAKHATHNSTDDDV